MSEKGLRGQKEKIGLCKVKKNKMYFIQSSRSMKIHKGSENFASV